MITLTAKINLLEGENEGIKVLTSESRASNISTQIPTGNEAIKVKGSNPFLLGISKLGDNAKFSNKNYFIGARNASADGSFSSPYYIYISSDTLTGFDLVFDTYNQRHPHSIIVDGIEFTENDSIYHIRDLEEGITHIVEISNWNTPNYPLVVQGIYAELNINIDNKNLLSLNAKHTDRSDITLPSWGIISNSGDISFVDTEGQIKVYAENGVLKSDTMVTISLNNTLSKKSQIVGVYKTGKWNYDNNNRQVSVPIKDDLEEWQNIQIERIELFEKCSFYDICELLKAKTPEKFKFKEYDTQTKQILTETICAYPYLESASLWNNFVKICKCCGLYIYKDYQDKIVISYEWVIK